MGTPVGFSKLALPRSGICGTEPMLRLSLPLPSSTMVFTDVLFEVTTSSPSRVRTVSRSRFWNTRLSPPVPSPLIAAFNCAATEASVSPLIAV